MQIAFGGPDRHDPRFLGVARIKRGRALDSQGRDWAVRAPQRPYRLTGAIIEVRYARGATTYVAGLRRD